VQTSHPWYGLTTVAKQNKGINVVNAKYDLVFGVGRMDGV